MSKQGNFGLELAKSEINMQAKVKEIKGKNDFSNVLFERDVQKEKDKIFDEISAIYERSKAALKDLREQHAAKSKGKKGMQRVPGTEEWAEVETIEPQQKEAADKLAEKYKAVKAAHDKAVATSTYEDWTNLDKALKKAGK